MQKNEERKKRHKDGTKLKKESEGIKDECPTLSELKYLPNRSRLQ